MDSLNISRLIGYRATKVVLQTIVILLVSMSDGQTSGAQTGESLRTDAKFSDHLKRSFHVKQGLPSGFVNDAIQTSDGYIWFATHGGIARFDGFKFKVFTRANSPLPSNDTRVLFEDSQGVLWIGTTGGLVRLHSGRAETFEELTMFRGNSIHAIYEDIAGKIWIGTREKTWVQSAPESPFEVVEEAPENVYACCETVSGTMLLGTKFGLFLQENDAYRRIEHERLPYTSNRDSGMAAAGVNALVPGNDGIWVCANRGLFHFKDGELLEKLGGVGVQRVTDALITRSGDLYAAVPRSGIYRSVKSKSPLENIPTARLSNCLLEDSEGGLWIGYSNNVGVKFFANNLFRTHLSDEDVLSVFEDDAQTIWFGTRNGVFRRDSESGEFTKYDSQHGLPDQTIRTIFSKGKTLWVGTSRGIAKWNGAGFEDANSVQEMAQMHVQYAIFDSAGNLWFSLANGSAYRLADGKLSRVAMPNHGKTKWFYEQSPGKIWAGHEFGLYEIIGEEVSQISDPAFADFTGQHFISHFVEPDGTVWLATTTGIGRYKNGIFKSVTSKDGLAADYVDRLATDHHGNLWCGSRDGCFTVPIKEIDQFWACERKNITCRRVTMLPSMEVSVSGQKTCLATNGSMWMASAMGVIQVSNDKPQLNQVPPIPKLELIQLDNETVDSKQPFHFRSGRHRLVFHFGAVSFLDPENVRVEYRLDGYDDDWKVANKERTAHYTDLGPGDYQFQVTATNEDGVKAVSDSIVHLAVHPRWFETLWFRTIAVLSIIGLSTLTTLIYNRSVRRTNEELQKEIDERKRAENKLVRSEERFRDLAETTQAIPWEADAETFRFTFVGKQAVDVLGYPVEDWLEDDFWIEHLHPDDRLNAVELFQRAAQRGQSHQLEFRMLAADGSYVWLHDVVNVVMEDGVAKRLRGFLVDVTDRHSFEEKARDHSKQLARLNRASSMGEMASSIAHEVNQPLFAIVGNAQIAQRLLNREPPDMQEVRAALSEIVSDGNRASQIIDSVRALVRKEQQPTMPLDLNQVALEAIEFIEPEIRKRGFQLKTNLASGLPTISGNSIELQQVILNLIINGAQAMDNASCGKHELSLTTSADDGFVTLQVHDHGSGIDQELADRLFEPFFTTKPQGTGMGLSINRTIIEAHHGRIWVESEEGHGATFCFRLPVSTEVVA